MRNLLMIAATAALLLASGCGGVRFVVDAVPAIDELTETTVLEDRAAGLGPRSRVKVAMIDVSGLIADAGRPGVLAEGENPLARFAEALRRAERDDKVVAVVVRVNSPGGTVTASDVMYRELRHFRDATKKPVVILMGDVAASGGYYLACAGDVIVAHPTTITGSIGVVIQTINFSEGMRRIGIRADSITSGPNKAMGSPFEPMSEEHRALLQGIVDEFHANFLAVVRERRPALSEADVARVTDGRVVTGRAAAEVGLVDGLGDLRDAWSEAKRLAGVRRARLVKYHRPLEYVGSAFSRTPPRPGDATAAEINLLQLNVDAAALREPIGFYYLWDPAAW